MNENKALGRLMLLTVDQVAHELGGVSPGLVRKHIRSGRLVAVHLGRCVRVDPADLVAYVERNKTAEGACSKREAMSGGSDSTTSTSVSRKPRASMAPDEARIERELLEKLNGSKSSTGKRTLRLLKGAE